ncbi:MAG: DUF3052 domain-containing protein [Planctomycetes bacterium]|nr:DUF3052 domain-containing protein [Planctomycetota bacterium]
MAGYSNTPLAKKLGIKENARVLLLAAPDGFERTLDALPPGVTFTARGKGPFDVAIAFAKTTRECESRFRTAAASLSESGGLWTAWPKKTSGVATDLNENDIRAFGLSEGLVDNKVCAIDDTWSGLRFVKRLKDRTPATPPTKTTTNNYKNPATKKRTP